MKNFYLWLSVLTPRYEKTFSSELVAKGYIVQALDGKNVSLDNCLAYSLQAEKSLKTVEKEIVDIIAKNNMYYHVLVVSEFGGAAMWRGTNISLKTVSKEEKEIEDTMTHINKLLSSYQASPLTEEEKKRLIERRKNS